MKAFRALLCTCPLRSVFSPRLSVAPETPSIYHGTLRDHVQHVGRVGRTLAA